MLSNVLLIEVPWHQNGWDGTICAAPEENSAYCLPSKQQSLVSFCQAMAGLPHLDRSATTESRIRQGLRCLAFIQPKEGSPSLDCSQPPDPTFGRRHLSRVNWYSAATLSALPMLRPDPWCSPSFTTFKTKPSLHGLANLCTDDCFTLSGLDKLKLLDGFPSSWRHLINTDWNQDTDLGEDGNDRRLYALICCKNHPLAMGDEDAVVVVGALRVRWVRNKGELWQFKGETGYRLPLQELQRYDEEKRSDVDERIKITKLMDALPTVDYFPGRFGSITPKGAEQILEKMVKSAGDLGGLPSENSPFSQQHATTFAAQFKKSPPFKYPNLGQVLQFVTGDKASPSKHMESYFKDEEDKLVQTLCDEVDKLERYTVIKNAKKVETRQYSDQQKNFLKNYLIYYDIPASYLPAALELFCTDYSSHWGSYKRIANNFANIVLNNSPYHLAMGVILPEDKEEQPGSLTLDFRRIDEGERQRLGDEWQKDEMIRQQALRYDEVLREEKDNDWAAVSEKDGDKEHPFLGQCDERMVQRKTLHKARQLVDAFYAEGKIVTPGDGFALLNDKRKNELKNAVKEGFSGFYKNKFPEAKQQPDFDESLKTPKGEQVSQAINEQSDGLIEILTNRFTIITGKAGAGKSEMFKKVVEELHASETFLFMAPTGKAVQAIKEKIDGIKDDSGQPVIPGEHYCTIQKFLVQAGATNDLFEPEDPASKTAIKEEKTLPLDQLPNIGDLSKKPVNIIIDEASMIDLELMGNLCHTLQELWKNPDIIRRLVLVGDINQLPPVRSGYPFRKLLFGFEDKKKDGDNSFGFQRLDISLRFIMGETNDLILTRYADSFCGGDEAGIDFPSEDGNLQAVAANLLTGTFSDRQTLDDCLDKVFELELNFMVEKGYHAVTWNGGKTTTTYDALKANLAIAQQQLNELGDTPEQEKLSAAAKDIPPYFLDLLQFIIPTKKGYFGVTQLTPRIRKRYPKSDLVKYIQNRNDNKKEIFNGNLAAGFPKQEATKSTMLFYPDSCNRYEFKSEVPESSIDEAYAITVHKSQGSGFSITVAILPESIHEGLRSPQMQYTAVTRTKDICILLKEK